MTAAGRLGVLGCPNSPPGTAPLSKIDTMTGEHLLVAAHGHDIVTVSVSDPRFGRIAHVRLTHDQVATLAGALTGLVLEHGACAFGLSDEPA